MICLEGSSDSFLRENSASSYMFKHLDITKGGMLKCYFATALQILREALVLLREKLGEEISRQLA